MSKVFVLLMVLSAFRTAADLNIYLVDVEGGQGTLIVAPSGQSLLIDTGIAGAEGRDPKRIFDLATNVAHLRKIDYLLITHYHGDHIGGVPALAKMIPIDKFLDHGELTLESDRPPMVQLWSAYKQVADDKRTILQPGDKIPVAGLEITVVTSAGKAITKPINGGGPNAALCKDGQQKPTDQDPENASSVGILLTYNKFRFADLGDLPWLQEQQLACPVNMLGTVDVYQTTHHGLDRSGSPQLVWALKPHVVLMNNGSRKGGAASTFEILRKSPGLLDLWQGHYSLNADKELQSDEKMIANMEPTGQCQGNWLRLTVQSDGTYTVTNGRNHFSKSYTVR